MTPAGWAFLAASWAAILALCGFCFFRMVGHRRR